MSDLDVPDQQMAHFTTVAAGMALTVEQTAQALAFLLGSSLARLEEGDGPYTDHAWMDAVSEAAHIVTQEGGL